MTEKRDIPSLGFRTKEHHNRYNRSVTPLGAMMGETDQHILELAAKSDHGD